MEGSDLVTPAQIHEDVEVCLHLVDHHLVRSKVVHEVEVDRLGPLTHGTGQVILHTQLLCSHPEAAILTLNYWWIDGLTN